MKKKELLHFDSKTTPPFWDADCGINYVALRDILNERGIRRDADGKLCLQTPDAIVHLRIKELDRALFLLMIEKDAPYGVFYEFFRHTGIIHLIYARQPKLPDYKYDPCNVKEGGRHEK